MAAALRPPRSPHMHRFELTVSGCLRSSNFSAKRRGLSCLWRKRGGGKEREREKGEGEREREEKMRVRERGRGVSKCERGAR